MLFAGLDIGSVSTKAVVWDDAERRTISQERQPSGWEPRAAGEACLHEALAGAGLTVADLRGMTVTGYGRTLWRGSGQIVTELTCLQHGAREAVPAARTIFDIGGQDSKALALDPNGELLDFVVNDRCAAGTGRFLAMAGERLGLSVTELGGVAESATESVRLSSLCAVFAESEVVGLLAQGHERSALARGLCEAVAQQLLNLAGRLPREAPLALVGGVAYNHGVRCALQRALGEPVIVPEEPQLIVALGAAILAAKNPEQQ